MPRLRRRRLLAALAPVALACVAPAVSGCASGGTQHGVADVNDWWRESVMPETNVTIGDAYRHLRDNDPWGESARRFSISRADTRVRGALEPTADRISIGAAATAIWSDREHQALLNELSFGNLDRTITRAQQR